jgi:hypothetical protein
VGENQIELEEKEAPEEENVSTRANPARNHGRTHRSAATAATTSVPREGVGGGVT